MLILNVLFQKRYRPKVPHTVKRSYKPFCQLLLDHGINGRISFITTLNFLYFQQCRSQKHYYSTNFEANSTLSGSTKQKCLFENMIEFNFCIRLQIWVQDFLNKGHIVASNSIHTFLKNY